MNNCKTLRDFTKLTIECHAPEGTFATDYDDVPDEAKEVIEKQNGLPCEGGGLPGRWCLKCRDGTPCAYVETQ